MPKTKKPPRKLISVYPAPWAVQVVRQSSVTFNQAIECWAQVVAKATQKVEDAFSPDEWACIAAGVSRYRFDTKLAEPGKTLAMILKQPEWISGAAAAGVETASLRQRLEKLDFVSAWAVIWACSFHQAHPSVVEWWKLSERTSVED